MQQKVTISFPYGDRTLEEFEKVIGREPLARAIRNSISVYIESVKSSGKVCVPLPHYKTLERKLFDMDDVKKIEEFKNNLAHLLEVTDKVLQYKKGYKKFDF